MAKRAKSAKKRGRKRVAWTKGHERELKTHSKKKTPVTSIARAMKRTAGALRQKAHARSPALTGLPANRLSLAEGIRQ